eukprot:6213100-Pleurochrysis_carterae.AAC.2
MASLAEHHSPSVRRPRADFGKHHSRRLRTQTKNYDTEAAPRARERDGASTFAQEVARLGALPSSSCAREGGSRLEHALCGRVGGQPRKEDAAVLALARTRGKAEQQPQLGVLQRLRRAPTPHRRRTAHTRRNQKHCIEETRRGACRRAGCKRVQTRLSDRKRESFEEACARESVIRDWCFLTRLRRRHAKRLVRGLSIVTHATGLNAQAHEEEHNGLARARDSLRGPCRSRMRARAPGFGSSRTTCLRTRAARPARQCVRCAETCSSPAAR